MKTFLKFTVWLVLAVAFNLRADTTEVAEFTGTVVDAQGNPVADATVSCYQYPASMGFGPVEMELKQRTTTDGQGAFTFPMFQRMGVVVVTKAGTAPTWRTWYGTPDGAQKFVLSTSSVLAGVVADDSGRPVADAEVWVSSAFNTSVTDIGQPNSVYGNISHELFSARTSTDGQFRIENFPADAQASLSVKKDGLALHPAAMALADDELPFHAGQEDITLTLEPAGTVSGKLVVRDTGQPLASALIGLEPSAPGMASLFAAEGTNASAADGSFQISDIPAGSYQVMAEFTNEPVADWVADAVPVTVIAGQTASGVQLQAYKGGVVEITVTGKSSQEPLVDAEVSINSQDLGRSGRTGSNGVASFRLPPGQYNTYASKQGWSQAQSSATVTDGQTTQVTVELNEPLKIRGIVRDASGAPVAGANVHVFPEYGIISYGTKSDANGHYETSWDRSSWGGGGNQSFYMVVRDSEQKLAAIQGIDESTTNLDVTLAPAMSLSGRVQDPSGRPITNATAYVILYQEDGSGFTINNRQLVRADEQGRLQMDAVPMGERYGWYVNARGYGSAQQQMDAADPKADHYDFPPLVLNPANRKLAGRVLDAKGAPAAGAQIFMQGEGQPNGNAVSDADGWFVFDAVCDGPVTLSANLKGANGSTQTVGGDTNVVIRFESGNRNYYQPVEQTLSGTVHNSSGDPAAGVSVIVSPSMGREDAEATDENGKFSVSWSPQPGMAGAKYFAIARDVGRNLAAIAPVGNGKTSVDLQLGPSLSISGTVQDSTGAPLPHANINLNIMAGNMGGLVVYGRIKLNSDGAFTIPALPMGQKYMVMVSDNGHGSAQKNIGVAESRTNSIQLTPFKLKTADLELAGVVEDAKGKPLPGTQIFINGRGQPNGNATSDGAGHFHFKVCDGPVQIFAWSQSGNGRNNSANMNAFGGDTNLIVKMGAQQRQPRQRQAVRLGPPLKPQAWTIGAVVDWPKDHKTGTIVLLSLQAVVLLGTVGGIFWHTRKRPGQS